MNRERLARWREDNLLRRVLRNSSYLSSSNALSGALGLLQGILATRLIGVDGYGLVTATIVTFASNVNNLLSFRMSEAMVKFYGDALQAGEKERAAAIAKGIGLVEIATSILTYIVLLLLTPWAARALGKDIQTAPLFMFYGLVILANLVYETSRGVLQTNRRFDLIGRITMLQSIITAAMIVMAFLSQGGIFEILAAYLAGKVVAGLVIALFALRELSRSLGRNWWHTSLNKVGNWREIFTFALSTNLNGTINLIARDSAPLVLVWLRPAEVAHLEAGYFRLASSLINYSILPIEPLLWPTYAEITRTIAERKWHETRSLLRRVSLISAAWMALAGGGLALLGWWLIPFLYTTDAAPAYAAVLILLIGYSFGSIFTWNRPLLLALGKPAYPLVIAAVVGVIELALAVILVPRFGYLAQAALLSGYFIVAIGLITWRGLREILRAGIESAMNIVAIAGSTIPSDTANSIQVMKACAALAQLGHNLTLLVPDNRKSSIENRTREAQSKIVNLKSHYGLQTDFPIEWLSSSSRRLFTWQSVQRARTFKPDLLYTWFPQSAVFGLLYKLPVVFEIHIQPTGLLGPYWHRAFAKLRGKKRLVSITRALVNILERDYNMRLKPGEVVIAPNGVDLERFASLPDTVTARRQLGLREALTVMCTGHLYAGRGADLFLALAKSIPHAHFVWVGGRLEDIASWKRRAESQNISNITFTGFIPNSNLPLYQAAADILLMPYRRSIMGSSGTADSASVASPMKMFEYMAAGRAIVSADLPVI